MSSRTIFTEIPLIIPDDFDITNAKVFSELSFDPQGLEYILRVWIAED